MNALNKMIRNISDSLFFRSRNPHQVSRNGHHLHNEYRRILTAPDLAVEVLMAIALKDEHFRDLLPKNEGPGLVRLAVVGNFLYANVFELHEFPGGPMEHPFNEDWRKDSIIDYLVATEVSYNDKGRPESFIHSLEPIVRHYHTHHSFDPDEPIHSYALALNKEELEQINRLSVSHHRRKAA